MNYRRLVRLAFTSGAAITAVLLVSVLLAITLAALGDHRGVSGVWGVVLVSAVLWFLNLVALLALVSLTLISEDDRNRPPSG